MNRTIIHLDLDTFFVSVERLQDSRLAGKPILVGGTGDRGVVSSASYEARKFGVHSGMAMKLARRICPEAIVVKGDASHYTKYSRIVTDIIRERVPVLEKASIDEFYADLSGMDRYFGCYRYATELRERIIRESGLPISFGMSVNKVVSKIATGEAKPNNQQYIEQGKEQHFLGPLSVRKIPMVGEKTHQALMRMGVQKVHTIQAMPMEMMAAAFGKMGVGIWQSAQGIDNRPLEPYYERKSISNERTLHQDTTDVSKLHAIIKAMTENLAYQMRTATKLCGVVSVKIRYSDFQTHSKQVKIAYTAADHKLIPTVIQLFDALYTRRILIRLVGVHLSDIVNGHEPLYLFEDQTKMNDLYDSMDGIRQRFGEGSIQRASTMKVRTIGRMGNPFDGEPPVVLAHRTQ